MSPSPPSSPARRWRYIEPDFRHPEACPLPGVLGVHEDDNESLQCRHCGSRAVDVGPVVVVMSEAEIVAEYFPYWARRMERAGKADQITEAACIDDWIVVHWAEPLDES